MEIYCEPKATEAIIAQSESFGIPAQIIGRTEVTERSDGQNHVTIKHADKTLTYELER